MLFVATCIDKANHLQTRVDNRPQHLAYLNGLGARLKVAGALLGPDNQTPIGTMLICDVADQDDALKLVDNDPFAKAGLFESVSVKGWRQGAGAPLA